MRVSKSVTYISYGNFSTHIKYLTAFCNVICCHASNITLNDVVVVAAAAVAGLLLPQLQCSAASYAYDDSAATAGAAGHQ